MRSSMARKIQHNIHSSSVALTAFFWWAWRNLFGSFLYAGVSAQYVFKIRYADSGPSVDADKLAWQDDIESTMEALQQLRTELKTVEPNAIVVVGCARRARDGVARWLARVPAADVERVSALLKSVRNADVNRDGQLSDAELATTQSYRSGSMASAIVSLLEMSRRCHEATNRNVSQR